jgi:hypothetical protein
MLKQVVRVITAVLEMTAAGGGTISPQLVHVSFKFCLLNVLFSNYWTSIGTPSFLE